MKTGACAICASSCAIGRSKPPPMQSTRFGASSRICRATCRSGSPISADGSVPREVLHLLFVLFSRGARLERAEIAPLARLGVLLARIETVAARRQFADHRFSSEDL